MSGKYLLQGRKREICQKRGSIIFICFPSDYTINAEKH